MKKTNIIQFLMIFFVSGLLTACGIEDDSSNSDTSKAPVISGTPANTVNEGSAYHFAPMASDDDSDDSLVFSITNKPSWASFNNQTGILNGTPGLDDAADYDDIIISVSDGNATAELSAFTISVINTNQIPVISGTPANTVNEGSAYHFAPMASDGDSDDSLTFSISNKPSWAIFNNQTGVLNGTPGLDDAADYGNIIISVSDGNASAQLSAFTITVADVSQALTVSTHNPITLATGISLHSNITITFNAPLDAATVTGTSISLQGTSNTAISTTLSTNNQTITIDPVSDLEPLTTYTVTITTVVSSTNGEALNGDYSWSFTTLAGAVLPELALWETYMVEYGQKWGDILLAYTDEELTSPVARNNVYYDGQRVFFQIADYTGDAEPWNRYAQRAEEIYRDHYAIPNDYGVQGYRRFSHGLYMDAIRTGDSLSADGVFQLRDKPPFSNPERFGNVHRWYWSGLSREIAYAIESHVISEQAGYPRLETRMALYIDMALNHIHEWTTGEYGNSDSSNNRVAPFMIGLTAEALITDYEWNIGQGKVADARIPIALKAVADHLMVAKVKEGPNAGTNMWIESLDDSGYGAFRYEDAELSPTGTRPAPALNLLIAPMYAWLYKHYGEQQYLEMGDKIFAGGVRLAEGSLDWSGKQFNQNYRWSFDYIKWRNEGLSRWN